MEELQTETLEAKSVEYEAQAESNETYWECLKENIVMTETQVLLKMN